jgi:chloramphenicol-sensitive protein RarD
MSNGKHYAAAITAFVIWGFFSIPLRALQGYTAGDILYFRILFSLLILLVIVSIKRNDFKEAWKTFRFLESKERKRVVFLTLAGGALLTINWLVFIYVVNNINIKTASFSYLICPVITAVLGYVLIRENMTRIQWIAVGLCALSCILMGISSALELGFSFLTAFTYALYLISQRRNQGFDRIIMLCIQVLFAFLIINLFMSYLVTSVPDSFYFYGIILIIAVAFTVLPLFLNLFALNKINSATIGILMYLNPLINFTVAFLVFHETVTLLQIVGYSIIAIALIIFNLQNFGKIRTAIGK